jgi:hypothetical protein
MERKREGGRNGDEFVYEGRGGELIFLASVRDWLFLSRKRDGKGSSVNFA